MTSPTKEECIAEFVRRAGEVMVNIARRQAEAKDKIKAAGQRRDAA